MRGNAPDGLTRRPSRIRSDLFGAPHDHAASDTVDPELMPPGVIMRTEHHERIRFQGAKGPAEWLRQSFTRCSQQHSNFHVGRLPIRRPLGRSGVFVTVDEEKSRFTYRIPQCRNCRQQNGTIRSVHERELTSGYGCAQLCVQLPNHREERTSVEQPRFWITFRARPRHRKVWPWRDVARRQRRLEPGRAQRSRCASLPGFASHAVEGHANQSYDHFRLKKMTRPSNDQRSTRAPAIIAPTFSGAKNSAGEIVPAFIRTNASIAA